MLTHAKLRDGIAARTGYKKDVVAHVLDVLGEMVEEEILQQGEVVLQGLFRVVPVSRAYRAKPWNQGTETEAGLQGQRMVRRIILTIRPMRTLRKKLTGVLPPG